MTKQYVKSAIIKKLAYDIVNDYDTYAYSFAISEARKVSRVVVGDTVVELDKRSHTKLVDEVKKLVRHRLDTKWVDTALEKGVLHDVHRRY